MYWLGFTFVFHCIMYDIIMKWLISYWLGFTFTFHFNVIKQLVFCICQYKFLWTLEINIHLSLKASVNIVFKVHKNSHWPQQKTIIVYYHIMLYRVHSSRRKTNFWDRITAVLKVLTDILVIMTANLIGQAVILVDNICWDLQI